MIITTSDQNLGMTNLPYIFLVNEITGTKDQPLVVTRVAIECSPT